MENLTFVFHHLGRPHFVNILVVAMYPQIVTVNILICYENTYQS